LHIERREPPVDCPIGFDIAALRAAIHAWRGSTHVICGITSIQGIKTNV
jgi:hypothetical protein